MTDRFEFKKVDVKEDRSEITPMSKEEVGEEIREAAKEGHILKAHSKVEVEKKEEKPKAKPKPEPAKIPIAARLIQDLRLRDPKHKKTCSACARRMPLDKMDGGKADICDECK